MGLLLSSAKDGTWEFSWINNDEKRSQFIGNLTLQFQNTTLN